MLAVDKGKRGPAPDRGMCPAKLGGKGYQVPVTLHVVRIFGVEEYLEGRFAGGDTSHCIEDAEALSTFGVEGLDIGIQVIP